jgi:hypothetical protein
MYSKQEIDEIESKIEQALATGEPTDDETGGRLLLDVLDTTIEMLEESKNKCNCFLCEAREVYKSDKSAIKSREKEIATASVEALNALGLSVLGVDSDRLGVLTYIISMVYYMGREDAK